MIVVVILAIITAIALPNYQETVRKNKEVKAQQEILITEILLRQMFSFQQGIV